MNDRFPPFKPGQSCVPIWCVTPDEGRCIRRFFDTPAFSPSGRYLAVLRLPGETRMPAPGDSGEIVLVDLTGSTEQVVATTCGWETQMGCNLNWGQDDQTLLFNDVDTETWEPQLCRLDTLTGRIHRWPGGVYQVAPDGMC